MTAHELREARTLAQNYRRAVETLEEQQRVIRARDIEIARLRAELRAPDPPPPVPVYRSYAGPRRPLAVCGDEIARARALAAYGATT